MQDRRADGIKLIESTCPLTHMYLLHHSSVPSDRRLSILPIMKQTSLWLLNF